MENYYKILGINQTASPQQINQAYKSLLALYQLDPDKHGSGLYFDLTAAYNTLINKEKKEEYDRILNSILTPEEFRLLQKKQQEKEAYSDAPAKGRYFVSAVKIIKGRHLRYGAVGGVILALLLTNAYIQIRTNQKKDIVNNQQIPQNKLPFLPEQSATPVPIQQNIRNAATGQNPASVKHLIIAKKKNIPDAPSIKALPAVYQVKPHSENLKAMAVALPHNPGNEKDKVLATLGTPHSIVRYGNNTEIWHYTHNVIHFQNGRIVSLNGSPEQNADLQLN